MAIQHVVGARNAAADAVVGLLDAGAGANGTMTILDSGESVISTLNLSNPAYGAAANGIAQGNAIADDNNAVGGTAAIVRMNDTDGNEVWRGTVTVTGGGGDLELNDINIAAGAVVSITSHSYTASP